MVMYVMQLMTRFLQCDNTWYCYRNSGVCLSVRCMYCDKTK